MASGAGVVKKGSGKGGVTGMGAACRRGAAALTMSIIKPHITMSAWRLGERERITHPNRPIEATCDWTWYDVSKSADHYVHLRVLYLSSTKLRSFSPRR